jgi:hypothetical protein
MHRYLSGVLLVLLSLAAAPALAVGGYFAAGTDGAETTTIRAVVVREGNLTTLIVQPSRRGNVGGFAWVIPSTGLGPASDVRGCVAAPRSCPADPKDPSHEPRPPPPCPGDLFARLHEETGAKLVVLKESRGDLGCTESSRLTISTVAEPAFDLLAAAPPATTVLDAAGSAGIGSWLAGRGYRVTAESGALLGEHAAAGGFFVVAEYPDALALPPTAAPGSEAGPIVIQLGGDQPILPLALTGAAAAAEVELLLYVIARGRQDVAGFETRDLVVTETIDDGDLDAWYDGQLAAALADDGAPVFVVEYADFIGASLGKLAVNRCGTIDQIGGGEWFVTRLRARLPRAALVDLRLVAREGAAATERLRVRVRPGAEAEPAAMPTLGLLLLAGWVVTRCRRRRP